MADPGAGTVDHFASTSSTFGGRKPLRPASNYVWTGTLWVPQLAGSDGGLALSASGFSATATFTPAAAAYSANDVVDVAKAFTWVDKNGVTFAGGELMITSSVLQIATTALQASEAGYNLPLYNVTPPSAHADNDAWDVPSGDRAAYLPALALGTPVDLGSTLVVAVDGINRQITVGATGITYAELVTVAGFTATAVARKVTLHATAL